MYRFFCLTQEAHGGGDKGEGAGGAAEQGRRQRRHGGSAWRQGGARQVQVPQLRHPGAGRNGMQVEHPAGRLQMTSAAPIMSAVQPGIGIADTVCMQKFHARACGVMCSKPEPGPTACAASLYIA